MQNCLTLPCPAGQPSSEQIMPVLSVISVKHSVLILASVLQKTIQALEHSTRLPYISLPLFANSLHSLYSRGLEISWPSVDRERGGLGWCRKWFPIPDVTLCQTWQDEGSDPGGRDREKVTGVGGWMALYNVEGEQICNGQTTVKSRALEWWNNWLWGHGNKKGRQFTGWENKLEAKVGR